MNIANIVLMLLSIDFFGFAHGLNVIINGERICNLDVTNIIKRNHNKRTIKMRGILNLFYISNFQCLYIQNDKLSYTIQHINIDWIDLLFFETHKSLTSEYLNYLRKQIDATQTTNIHKMRRLASPAECTCFGVMAKGATLASVDPTVIQVCKECVAYAMSFTCMVYSADRCQQKCREVCKRCCIKCMQNGQAPRQQRMQTPPQTIGSAIYSNGN